MQNIPIVALLLVDYDVDTHHILKPPERQTYYSNKMREKLFEEWKSLKQP